MNILKAIGIRLMYIAIGIGIFAAVIGIMIALGWAVSAMVTTVQWIFNALSIYLTKQMIQVLITGLLILFLVIACVMMIFGVYIVGAMVCKSFMKKRGEKL